MPRLYLLIFILVSSLGVFGQFKIHAVGINTTCQTAHGHNMNGVNIGTGRINATATGGQQPYTYSISGNYTAQRSQSNGYFPQLYTAAYTVSVTDANGLYSDTTINISATLPIPSIGYPIIYKTSTCSGNDGQIIIAAQSGTQPFQYSIDGGSTYSTNNVFSNLSQGFYICDIQDANHCISFSWEGNLPSVASCRLSAYQSMVLSACGNDADKAFVSIYPTSDSSIKISYDGTSYRSPNNGFSSDTISNLGGGVQAVYLKDTITGETARSDFAIGKSCSLYITFVGVEASCQQSDGALTINATGGTSPYTYTMDGANYQTGNTFTGLASGDYSLTVMDASGALNSAIGTIYNKCPVVLASVKNITCSQNFGIVTASGNKGTRPFLFSIDGINFQTDSIFNVLNAGVYTMTLRDAKGFMDSTKAYVYNRCIHMTANTTDEICGNHNGSIVANATGGTTPYNTYFINNGKGFQTSSSSGTFYNIPADNYMVVVIDATTFTDTVMVTVKNITPTVNIGNDTTLCAGQSLLLSPNLNGASYIWQDGSTHDSYTVSKAGNYWVTANVNGCIVSDTIRVSFISLGNIFTSHDTSACIGNKLTLDAGHAGANFLWDDNSNGQTRMLGTNGTYWVKVSTLGCSASDTVGCHFIMLPIVTLPRDTSFCNGGQLVLNVGNNTNVTYLWNNGTIGNSLVVSQMGRFWLSASIKGCTSYDTVQVSVKPNPNISLGNDTTLCIGQTVALNATYNKASYLWQDGSTLPTYIADRQGHYSVTVTANGCDTTGKIMVSYITKPIINLGNDTSLCTTNKLILHAAYPQSTYLWQDGSSQPTYTVTEAGIYSLAATNTCGTAIDSVTIMYMDCACKFYVPSAFTPNGDGKNDLFKPSYECFFKDYQLRVYNRLGQSIFFTENADMGWDGILKGQLQPSGSYVWQIGFFDTLTGKAIKKTGTVILIR